MTASPKTTPDAVPLEGVTPILRVADTAASIHYYVTALGFNLDWQDPRVGFASVRDADALLQEYRGSGAKIRHLPTNYPWAYEMQVEDLAETFCASAPNQRRMSPQVNGWICMADAGLRRMAARRQIRHSGGVSASL
jgi:hypothetical protein